MSSVISLLIITLIILYVIRPYLQKKAGVAEIGGAEGNGRIVDLRETRDNLLSAIKDIEFDYEMGKLSPEDFSEIKTQYRDKAIEVLKEIEMQEGGNSKTRQSSMEGVCEVCKNPRKKGDRFCRHCGNQFNASKRIKP